MTEPSTSQSPSSPYPRIFFGISAGVHFLNALVKLFHRGQIEAAQDFLAACMWTFLAVGQPEWRPRPRWLFWGLIGVYFILVLANAGVVGVFLGGVRGSG